MTWQKRLAGYIASGAPAHEAFASLATDLDTMRDVALADAGCPEEIAFLGELYEQDKAKLDALHKAHLDAVNV